MSEIRLNITGINLGEKRTKPEPGFDGSIEFELRGTTDPSEAMLRLAVVAEAFEGRPESPEPEPEPEPEEEDGPRLKFEGDFEAFREWWDENSPEPLHHHTPVAVDGQMLADYRHENGLTQDDLNQKAGHAAASEIEEGRRVRLRTAVDYAAAIEANIRDFIVGFGSEAESVKSRRIDREVAPADGDTIRSLRERRRWTRAKLATVMAEVTDPVVEPSPSQIGRMENSEWCHWKYVHAAAAAFDVPMSAVIDRGRLERAREEGVRG